MPYALQSSPGPEVLPDRFSTGSTPRINTAEATPSAPVTAFRQLCIP
ncbi:MAG: hypothetical protein U0835_05585 [Isosphaeraceae bacterium]